MGQKVNPNGLRLGVNKDWQSKWYAKKDYAKFLNNGLKIRDFLKEELKDAAVSEVIIERTSKRIEVKINTAKPGVVIGRGGEDIEKLNLLGSIAVQSNQMNLSQEDRLLIKQFVEMRPMIEAFLTNQPTSSKPTSAPSHKISEVLDMMLLKANNCDDEKRRKKNTITKLLQAVGISLDDDYAKFHNAEQSVQFPKLWWTRLMPKVIIKESSCVISKS